MDLIRTVYKYFFNEKTREKIRPFYHPLNLYFKRYIRKICSGRVLSGPFKGMLYDLPNLPLPPLLGTYELELKKTLEYIFKKNFEIIINIGAAEGYYAINFGKIWPQAVVYAYESNPGERNKLKILSEHNNLTNLKIMGECKARMLQDLLKKKGRKFLLVDIEGNERELFTPQTRLSKKDYLLIETHDCFNPGSYNQLKGLFSKSHKLIELSTRERKFEDFPFRLSFLFRSLLKKAVISAMSEGRPGVQKWLLFLPKKEF